jgi:Dolichyl-phosphate-mannose-protein mannosyltransferase
MRIVVYSRNAWLMHDEAALALNVVRRGFVELLAPLDYLQTAPPLFLWLERAAALTLGANEWSLRLFPLLAGLATAPLTWRVGRRLLPESAATLAVGLVALSPALVQYAALVKPYALDALVTLLILDRVIATVEHNAGASQWAALAATGLLALVASTPAVFVLGGAIAFVLATALIERDRTLAWRGMLLAMGWGAAFVALVATVFRPAVADDTSTGKFMHWYWAANFLTSEPPGITTKFLALLWGALPHTFFGEAVIPNATTLFLAAIVVGVVVLVASRRVPVALLLTVPGTALIVASMLRRYPIAERLVLFAAPLSALLVATSQLGFRYVRSQRAEEWLTATATVAILALAAQGSVTQVELISSGHGSRVLVREAAAEHARGAPLWVSGRGESVWRFYTRPDAPPSQPRDASLAGLFDGHELEPDLVIGSWYSILPERILPVRDDTLPAQSSEWSATEAQRIRALTRPCALVFLSNIQPGEATALLTSTAALGGRLTRSFRSSDAELHEVCFENHLQQGGRQVPSG